MSRTSSAYAYDYAPGLTGQNRPGQKVRISDHPATVRSHRAWRLGPEAVTAYIAVWVVAVLSALLLVSRYSAMATVTYQIADMKRQIAQMDDQNESLERQVAELKRPERIMQIAVTQLGMVAPRDFQQAASTPLLAQAQETDQAEENSTQVARDRGHATLAGALDQIGRGLARLLAGPARTEAKGK